MQETIVAIIVLAALWKVVARYAPKSVGTAMHRFLLALLRRAGLSALARRMAAKKQAAAGACGSCSGCASGDGKTDQSPQTKEFSITPEQLKRTAQR